MKTISQANLTAISDLTRRFYATFDSRHHTPDLSRLHDMFVPSAAIYQTTESETISFTLEEFIAPRQTAFNYSQIRNFYEFEIACHTMGNDELAIRISQFEKQGMVEDLMQHQLSTKVFQFVNTAKGWRIVSLLWGKSIALEEYR